MSKMMSYPERRHPADTAMTAANFTPVLAPPRRPRYEVSVCPLQQLASVAERRELLNDLGMSGWKIAGIDDGVAYLQRETIG